MSYPARTYTKVMLPGVGSAGTTGTPYSRATGPAGSTGSYYTGQHTSTGATGYHPQTLPQGIVGSAGPRMLPPEYEAPKPLTGPQKELERKIVVAINNYAEFVRSEL